jgi:hypothetical protein
LADFVFAAKYGGGSMNALPAIINAATVRTAKSQRVVARVKTEGLEKEMGLGAADISLTFPAVWKVRSDLFCWASETTKIPKKCCSLTQLTLG